MDWVGIMRALAVIVAMVVVGRQLLRLIIDGPGTPSHRWSKGIKGNFLSVGLAFVCLFDA